MSYRSLEEALQAAGSPVRLLRNSQIGPYAFPVVRSEFTNWRDEQRAWRETCALFDQSHHMTDLYVEGPDALKLLSDLAVNSFKNFKVNQAKQFIACNHQGFVIGDAILFYLEDNRLSLVGRPPAANWVEYHASTGKYNVKTERDERSAQNQGRRKMYRYQVQGPNAQRLMEKVTTQPAPDIRFFNMGVFKVAGHDVRALRHGMVGQPGWELFGPWAQGDAICTAVRCRVPTRSASWRKSRGSLRPTSVSSTWVCSKSPDTMCARFGTAWSASLAGNYLAPGPRATPYVPLSGAGSQRAAPHGESHGAACARHPFLQHG